MNKNGFTSVKKKMNRKIGRRRFSTPIKEMTAISEISPLYKGGNIRHSGKGAQGPVRFYNPHKKIIEAYYIPPTFTGGSKYPGIVEESLRQNLPNRPFSPTRLKQASIVSELESNLRRLYNHGKSNYVLYNGKFLRKNQIPSYIVQKKASQIAKTKILSIPVTPPPPPKKPPKSKKKSKGLPPKKL